MTAGAGGSEELQPIASKRGLIELHELHGHTAERALAAGYYPLPSPVARWDLRHSALLTIRARREPAS